MLNSQLLPIQFVGGVDTKSDSKGLALTKLQALINGVFTKPGEICKRPGYSALGTSIFGGGSLSSGSALGNYVNELLQFSSGALLSYSPENNAWVLRGNAPSVTVTTQPIIRNTYAQTAQDSGQTTGGATQCFAWEDTRGGVRFSVLDGSTGAYLFQDQQLTTTGYICPKVIQGGGYFTIVVANPTTSSLGYYYIASTGAGSISAFQTLASDLNSSGAYDATFMSSKVVVSYANNAGGVKIGSLTPGVGGGFTTASTQASETSTGPMSLIPDTANTRVTVAYYNGTSVKILVRNGSTLAAVSSATVETLINVTSITGLVLSSTFAVLYYTVSASNTWNYLVRSCSLSSYTPGTPGVFLRSVALAAKAFLQSGTAYVPLVFQTLQQPTYFVADGSGNIVAKVNVGTAGGISTRPILPEVSSLSANNWAFPTLSVDLLTTNPLAEDFSSSTVPTYSTTGVSRVSLNFADVVNGYLSASLAENLHWGGGFLIMYDGGTSVEHGFHLYPENVLPYVALVGGTLSVPSGVTSADVQGCATYEWTDNQGQTHISAPSTPATAYLSPVPTGSSGAIGFVNSSGTIQPNIVTGTSVASSLVSSFVVSGLTNSGSPTLSLISPYVFPGMSVSGSGIPAGTYVTGVNGALSSITLSANATATVSGNFTFSVNQTVVASGSNPSLDDVFLQPVAQLPIAAFQPTAGVLTFQVANLKGLAVGQTVRCNNGLNITATITSVNTASSAIVISTAVGLTGAGILVATNEFTGTTTSSSITITGAPTWVVNYINTFAAGTLTLRGVPGFASGVTVSGASGTSITLAAAATGSGSQSLQLYFPADELLHVGSQLVNSTYLPSGTVVTSLQTNAAIVSASSFPSIPNGTVFTVPNTYAIMMSVPTLRITAKHSARAPVSVVGYRTPGNGSIFYRSSPVSSLLYNDTTVDAVAYADTSSDTTLLSGPQLYTTGGTLENAPPNPCTAPLSHKGRLWVIDSTNPLQLFYSKQTTQGLPVEFSPFLTQSVDPFGGDSIALGSMDDKLVLFKKTAIFWLGGQGPDPTGSNSDFGNGPILIPTDVGCSNPRSVVLTPMGLMFQTLKGIYLLSRDLSVRYIGASVEAYNAQTVTSAKLILNSNQVRFTLNNGTALAYDYLMDQWSVFNNVSAVDAAFYGTNFAYLQSGGVVMVETPGVFSDNGSFIPLSLTTAWVQTAGAQGFQRARRALVFGDYMSPHNLNVSVAYDFNPTPTQSDTLAVTSAPAGAEQVRVHLAQQKCEAIQFTIADSQNGAVGEGVRLSGITLEIGTKRGLNKVSAANSVG